jgi:hypothetical protein
MKRNAVTRSISQSVDSPAGDSLSEYQKGVCSASEFLRAVFRRKAVDNPRATSAADAPNNPDQQR